MQTARLCVITAIVTAAVCVLPSMSTSLSGQDNSAREARDRAEIEALMWRYARALDTGDGTAYASTYTPDGQFGTGANATKGHDALKKLADDVRVNRAAAEAKGEKRPPMYHMEANTWIEFVDKDHARYHAYYLTVFAAGDASTPVRVAAAGQSLDLLERVNGKWLIKVRDVAVRD